MNAQELLQRLKNKGARHADYTTGLSKFLKIINIVNSGILVYLEYMCMMVIWNGWKFCDSEFFPTGGLGKTVTIPDGRDVSLPKFSIPVPFPEWNCSKLLMLSITIPELITLYMVKHWCIQGWIEEGANGPIVSAADLGGAKFGNNFFYFLGLSKNISFNF